MQAGLGLCCSQTTEDRFSYIAAHIDIDSIECLSSHPRKSGKNLSEYYIKTETTTNIPVKFRKSQHNVVEGVAHQRYPVSYLVTLMVINA